MYLFLDTETGGIGLDKSLLTAFFLATNDKLEPLGELYLYLKPDDGVYKVTSEALGINKINLVEHEKSAVLYKNGGSLLYSFLKQYSNHGAIKLVPVGHNIGFDIAQIQDKLISRPTWENFVSYRKLDTQIVAQFLILCKKLDGSKTTGSLKSLSELFQVSTAEIGAEEGFHDARFDTMLTRAVLSHLIIL